MKFRSHPVAAFLLMAEPITASMTRACHRPLRSGRIAARLLTVMVMAALSGPAQTPSSSPARDLDVEVLSVSVSKLPKDGFGNPVNPFSSFSLCESDSGTVVLARVTPVGSSALELQPERCRVIRFTDDAGTDLSTNTASAKEDPFFSRNRPLEILRARDQGGFFGVRIRSARVPARSASRVTADVLLVFRPGNGEQSEQKNDVPVQTGKVVTVGPVKVKFTLPLPNPRAPTNQAAAGPKTSYWLVSFLPQTNIAVASATLFSGKSDEPILAVKNISTEGTGSSSSTGIYSRNPKPGSSEDPFSDCVGYGFTRLDAGPVTIKLRYFDVKSLVEKHCIISTGISP